MMNKQTYCGIDVAKHHFVIGLSNPKRTKTEANNPKGIAHPIEYLRDFSVNLIVLIHVATFVCVRFEPKLKQFYERLRANGKAFKVAINACMRKLLTILNAIVRDGSQWDAYAL
ncbi:hypothetical protein L5B83_07020 [Avibacterium sp. 21-599]|nr:hypothetical protein [Avibacterium sp. 21-599]MCW9718138.1 hypothetical protein [Avibacterium sp. 21-599]